MKPCPCDKQKRYMDCCGLYIQKKMLAETPEKLMRSRYSAFAEGNISYIRKTMRGAALLDFNKKNMNEDVIWLGLEVIHSALDPNDPNIGYVEFKAHYKQKNNKESGILHEKSRFEKMNGKWFYVSGE